MEPEEIIQQKEWQELNEEEKNSLLPLASDEEEFNLLKKMLMVVAEEASATPVIDPSVQYKLQSALKPVKSTTHFIKRWHYAAAAIVVIIASTWFIIQRPGTGKDITVIDNTGKKENAQPPFPEDSIPGQKDKSIPRIAVTDTEKARINKENNKIKKQKQDNPVNYVAINTTVKQNKELISFVTEVYD